MSKRKNLLKTANGSEILKLKHPHKKGRMVLPDRRETPQHRGVLRTKLRYSWSRGNIGERGSTVLRRKHGFNCNDPEKMG
jgi:hypothetical protein